jgi:hypothetical protein
LAEVAGHRHFDPVLRLGDFGVVFVMRLRS